MLAENEVHIWQLKLPQQDNLILQSFGLLSGDEIIRAGKYKFSEDHNNFIASRGVLRIIIGKYLDVQPENIKFSYTSYGKPFLSITEYPIGLNFNLSDTKGLVLYAFTLINEIGIDVEHLHEIKDMEAVAARFFSVNEVQRLKQVALEKRDDAFLSCWTLKEAYIKAIGEGLSCPLDQFEMAFNEEEMPALLLAKWDKNEKERWKMYRVQSPEGYIASMAVEGKSHELVYKDFDKKFLDNGNPRQGWEKEFENMHKNGDDKLIIDDIFQDENVGE